MNPIAINQIRIRQTNGLYCLNDLHRAAGNEKRHQPSDWLKNQQTKELIAELDGKPSIQENQSLNPTTGIFGVEQNQQVIQVVNGGDRRGTYVCRELVYAYAMWISPRFHIAVIHAFDALVSGSLNAPALPQSLPEALRLRAKKWIGSRSPIVANKKAIDAGYMVQTLSLNEQQGRYYPQALITAKGLAKLAQHFAAERQS